MAAIRTTKLRSPPSGMLTLGPLFGSLGINKFRSLYWPGLPWHGRPTMARLDAIGTVPQLRSLSTVLRTPGVYISAVSPEFRSDQVQDRGVTMTKANRLYSKGHTLTIGGIHVVVPRIGDLLNQLVSALELPCGGPFGRHRCIVYASPTGEAFACHFDPNANFVLQLQGRKLWRIAENRTVKDPVDVYSTRLPAGRAGRLTSYCHPENLPTRMPSFAHSVTLAPGSFMFLPRGYWHETEALEPSLSLHFVLHQPTWADIWMEAVSDRLICDAKWRSLASGLWSKDRSRRDQAVERLRIIAIDWVAEMEKMSVAEAVAKFHHSV
jgi:50S ribosomal protein L16 3-hydroxylase